MKKLNLLPLLACIALVAALSSFTAARLAEEQTRKVGPFTKVGLAYPANVVLRQGNTYSVKVEGDADQLEELVTEVEDGLLKIGKKNRNWDKDRNSSGRVKIYITMPKVEAIMVAGSGKVVSDDMFKADDLDLAVSGSGSIKISAKVNEVNSRISGSGSIELKGEGKESMVAISGSGSMSSFGFEADKANVRLSGSGTCEVKAKSSLKTSISGSGNVYYEGSPGVIDSRVSGSGSVKRRG